MQSADVGPGACRGASPVGSSCCEKSGLKNKCRFLSTYASACVFWFMSEGINPETKNNKNKMISSSSSSASLHDYKTGEFIRFATLAELSASIEAGQSDGGRGVISVDGRSCYVSE